MAQSHKVQSGDTLGAIAKKLGTSVSNLTGFRSGNADLIFPGETITVKSPTNSEATDRASTIRTELTDSPTTTTTPDDKDSSLGGFDFSSLQESLKETQQKKKEAFEKLDGFQTKRYDELVSERGLNNNKDQISSLDQQITQKKNERDASLAKIKSNPGASASTLTGEISVATDKLNDEINNLIGQRNSFANEYNSALAEIESMVDREAGDLKSSLGFFEDEEASANSLIASYQQALIDQLTREEDRQFSLDDDLRDFEQALQIAQIKASNSGSGTNYTILTDQFGRPTVAIDKNNPTQQIELSGTEGSLPVGGTDPALLQSIVNNQSNDSGKGVIGNTVDWFKGLFN